MKVCTRCSTAKPKESFGKCSTRSDGLHPWCRLCRSEAGRSYRTAHLGQARVCIRCGAEFRQKTSPSYCTDCHTEMSAAAFRRWKAANPDAARERKKRDHLRAGYQITLEEYVAMQESQGGGCAICGVERSKNGRHLAVDHCHASGRIRGLLCDRCNYALGQFDDRPELLKRAAEYLDS